jgi:hypothetical protein
MPKAAPAAIAMPAACARSVSPTPASPTRPDIDETPQRPPAAHETGFS